MKRIICNILGHKWNYIGNIRKCSRCGMKQQLVKKELTKLGEGMFRYIEKTLIITIILTSAIWLMPTVSLGQTYNMNDNKVSKNDSGVITSHIVYGKSTFKDIIKQ